MHRRAKDPEDSRREAWATSAYPLLYRRAWNLTRNTMAAQDLTQQAILRVLRRWPVADGPTKYAMRCMTNEFIDAYRRHRRHPEEPRAELPDEPSREDLAGSVVDHVVLTQALARLTARQHVIVDYYLAAGMPFAEIADLLGINESSVYREYRKALDIMRAYLREPTMSTPTTERATSAPTTERGTTEAEARLRSPANGGRPAERSSAGNGGQPSEGSQAVGGEPAERSRGVGVNGSDGCRDRLDQSHKERVS